MLYSVGDQYFTGKSGSSWYKRGTHCPGCLWWCCSQIYSASKSWGEG